MKNESGPGDPGESANAKNSRDYWKRWYVAVIVFLIAQIIFYYFITQHFKKAAALNNASVFNHQLIKPPAASITL